MLSFELTRLFCDSQSSFCVSIHELIENKNVDKAPAYIQTSFLLWLEICAAKKTKPKAGGSTLWEAKMLQIFSLKHRLQRGVSNSAPIESGNSTLHHMQLDGSNFPLTLSMTCIFNFPLIKNCSLELISIEAALDFQKIVYQFLNIS